MAWLDELLMQLQAGARPAPPVFPTPSPMDITGRPPVLMSTPTPGQIAGNMAPAQLPISTQASLRTMSQNAGDFTDGPPMSADTAAGLASLGRPVNPRADTLDARHPGLGGPSSAQAPGAGLSPAPGGTPSTGVLGEEAAFGLYSEPDIALKRAFMQAGLDPDQNRFARGAVERLAPVMQWLYQLWAMTNQGQGVDAAESNASLAQWLQPFLQQLMAGNTRDLPGRALAMADSNPLLKSWFEGIDPNQFIGLMERTSGEAPGMAAARSRLRKRGVERQRMAEFDNPAGANDATAWLRVINGR